MRSSRILNSRYLRVGWSAALTAGILTLTLAIVSSAAHAQYGGGGQRRQQPGANGEQNAPPRQTQPPALWQPEQIFPLAITYAAQLHLTDEQRSRIETIGSQLRAKNAPLLTSIDTLKPEPIPPPVPGAAPAPYVPMTPDQVAAVVARRHALGEARAQLHDNTKAARDSLTALLTPEQQSRLAEAETNARVAAERGETLDAPRGGRGGARDGAKTPDE